jgi:hypothetical protein
MLPPPSWGHEPQHPVCTCGMVLASKNGSARRRPFANGATLSASHRRSFLSRSTPIDAATGLTPPPRAKSATLIRQFWRSRSHFDLNATVIGVEGRSSRTAPAARTAARSPILSRASALWPGRSEPRSREVRRASAQVPRPVDPVRSVLVARHTIPAIGNCYPCSCQSREADRRNRANSHAKQVSRQDGIRFAFLIRND